MSTPLKLSNELRKLVEKRMNQTLEGIEDTFHLIRDTHEIEPKELKADLESLDVALTLYSRNGILEFFTLSSSKAL